jgi:kanamycin kinase
VSLAGPPPPGTGVPQAMERLADGATIELVWLNLLGGLTARAGDRFIKWSPAASTIDFDDEAARLVWAGRFHPVPEVVGVGNDDEGSWMVTRAIDAQGAVSDRWRSEPDTAVRAIGAGLRALHDTLPVAGCPFPAPSWTILGGELTVPADDLVVCHGDSCAPNTLIADDGRWAAHVDVGALGPADRWSDLAVASMSLGWNFGEGWEPAFFEAYGIDRDEARILHYRALWDRG